MHMYTARVSAAALLILLALGLPLKAAAQTLMDTVIVFSSDRDGDYEIHSVRQDASELSQLTTNTGDDDAPEVSPDGTRIAFHSDRSGNYDIWAMDLSGANAVNLSQDDGVDKFPAWSPDGSRIAFMSTRDGSENIWVMGSLVGDVPTAVTGTSAPVRNNHPDWSLTGEIAFDSDRANQGWLSIWWAVEDASVWSMLPQLVSDEESMYPAWSADGSALAYKSQTPNPIALRSVSIVDGIPGTPISVVSGDVKLCDWSPDGAKIVYSNGGDIYVVDSDGLNAGLLESDSESTSEKSPSWSPYLIAPEISVLPPSLDFGDVQILQPAMEILTVTSTGAATLTVSDITSDNAAFTVAPDTAPLPFDLAAADPDLTETVTVTFTPTVEGAQSANITITHNAADSPTVVTVTGSGAVPPSITIAADSYAGDFAATLNSATDSSGRPIFR